MAAQGRACCSPAVALSLGRSVFAVTVAFCAPRRRGATQCCRRGGAAALQARGAACVALPSSPRRRCSYELATQRQTHQRRSCGSGNLRDARCCCSRRARLLRPAPRRSPAACPPRIAPRQRQRCALPALLGAARWRSQIPSCAKRCADSAARCRRRRPRRPAALVCISRQVRAAAATLRAAPPGDAALSGAHAQAHENGRGICSAPRCAAPRRAASHARLATSRRVVLPTRAARAPSFCARTPIRRRTHFAADANAEPPRFRVILPAHAQSSAGLPRTSCCSSSCWRCWHLAWCTARTRPSTVRTQPPHATHACIVRRTRQTSMLTCVFSLLCAPSR